MTYLPTCAHIFRRCQCQCKSTYIHRIPSSSNVHLPLHIFRRCHMQIYLHTSAYHHHPTYISHYTSFDDDICESTYIHLHTIITYVSGKTLSFHLLLSKLPYKQCSPHNFYLPQLGNLQILLDLPIHTWMLRGLPHLEKPT